MISRRKKRVSPGGSIISPHHPRPTSNASKEKMQNAKDHQLSGAPAEESLVCLLVGCPQLSGRSRFAFHLPAMSFMYLACSSGNCLSISSAICSELLRYFWKTTHILQIPSRSLTSRQKGRLSFKLPATAQQLCPIPSSAAGHSDSMPQCLISQQLGRCLLMIFLRVVITPNVQAQRICVAKAEQIPTAAFG